MGISKATKQPMKENTHYCLCHAFQLTKMMVQYLTKKSIMFTNYKFAPNEMREEISLKIIL